MTERRARRIQRHSGNLSHTRVAELSSWEAHGVELAQIRDEVNALKERGSNLGALTNRSIAKFNERPPARWILPEYAQRVDTINDEAVALEAATK